MHQNLRLVEPPRVVERIRRDTARRMARRRRTAYWRGIVNHPWAGLVLGAAAGAGTTLGVQSIGPYRAALSLGLGAAVVALVLAVREGLLRDE